MRIPERQEQLDKLTRKYLTEPKAEEDGRRHTAATNALTDEEIIALCRKAKNAAKFADLFDAGHTAAYNGDDSSADLALVSIIAFYTQDEGQIDRISACELLRIPFGRSSVAGISSVLCMQSYEPSTLYIRQSAV